MEPIETERLILRPFVEEDVERIYQLVYADPEVKEAWSGYSGSLSQFRARFAIDPVWHANHGFGFLAIIRKEGQLLIGLIGFQRYEPEEDTSFMHFENPTDQISHDPARVEVELTYAIGRAYWKQGYATEAGKAMIARGFRHFGIDRIVNAVIDHEKHHSLKLMRRLGFRITRNLNPAYMTKGPFQGAPGAIGILENPDMSSLQIRLATSSDADYAARWSVLKTVEPNVTVEKLKLWDSWSDPKYRREIFLADVDGVAVATASYGEWIWWYEPGRYVLYLTVHPDYRRQGIGSALYDVMMEKLAAENPPARILMCKCHEEQPDSVRFLTKRGFQQTGRELFSELDVPAFDSQPFAALCERVRRQGIEIVAYPELAARDPECRRKCYDVWRLSQQDVLARGTRTWPPFEQFVQTVLENPVFVPDAFFVALDHGRYVGQSDLIDEKEDREHLVMGYTGVIPDYRRRGIATALKVRGIHYAQAHGVKTISTGNNADNPMYDLNVKLGFKPLPAELLFEKKLEPPVE